MVLSMDCRKVAGRFPLQRTFIFVTVVMFVVLWQQATLLWGVSIRFSTGDLSFVSGATGVSHQDCTGSAAGASKGALLRSLAEELGHQRRCAAEEHC